MSTWIRPSVWGGNGLKGRSAFRLGGATSLVFRDNSHRQGHLGGCSYHMFLSVVPGIFTNWNAPRDIVHLSSRDLLKWKYESTLKLSSDPVIDACVMPLPE
jgi:hypothetical protein